MNKNILSQEHALQSSPQTITTAPHPKSKESGKHPWGLSALMTVEQDRAGQSMAAHEMRRH